MKLHLPKQLMVAVVATMAFVGNAVWATSLDDAILSLDDFSESTISGLGDAWVLTNISASEEGTYTTTDNRGTIASADGTSLTTNVPSGGSNRYTWSAIVTVDVETLKNAVLVQGGNSNGVGMGYSNGNVTGTWNGDNPYSGMSLPANLDLFSNGDGTITFGVSYDGTKTTVYVGNTQLSNTGLKWGTDTSKISLANAAGVTYTNLYWFNTGVSDGDMKSMVLSFDSVDSMTWNGTEGDAAWNESSSNWLVGTSADTFKNGNSAVFGVKEGISRTVAVDGQITARYLSVMDDYTFNVGDGASLTATSVDVAAGKTMTVNGAVSLSVLASTGTLSVTRVNTGNVALLNAGNLQTQDIHLTASAALANGSTTTYAGVLTVDSGVTFTTTAGKESPSNISSIKQLVLDGGTLSSNSALGTVNNLTVTQEGGRINYTDFPNFSGGVPTHTDSFAQDTTLNGQLTIHTTYKSSGTIAHLTGAGTLQLETDNRNDGGLNLTISSLRGFTGNVVSAPGSTGNAVKLTIDSGAGSAVSMGTMTLKNGSVLNVDATSELNMSALLMTGSTVNFNSGTTKVTQLMYSKESANAGTVNVAAGATLHIVGTTTSAPQGGQGGSFETCNWGAANVLNVSGHLISEAGITMEGGGKPVVNIKDGGVMTMNAGLSVAVREKGSLTTINVENGGTLQLAGKTGGQVLADTDRISVVLQDGSKLEGIYGEDTSVTINKSMSLQDNATVTLVTAEGKDMVISGTLSNASGTIAVAGPGTATLGNTAEIAGLAAGENSTIVIADTTAVGTSVTMGTGSAIVNNGNLTMSGTAALYAADGIGVKTEKALETGNGLGTIQVTAALSDIITGTGTTTASGVTAWTVNGNAATYDSATGVLIYSGGNSDKYYINDASAALSVTTDGELVSVVDNFNEYINISGGKNLDITGDSQVNMVNEGPAKGVWMEKDSSITVKDTSSLTVAGDIKIAAADPEGEGAHITASGDTNQIGTNQAYHDTVTISNADVTVEGATMRSYKVEGGTVILKDAESATTTTINATLSANGQLTNLNVGRNEEAKFGNVDVALKELTMAGGSQVTLGGDDHNQSLKLTKLTVTDANAAINANLDLTDATVTLGGKSVALGCTLTLGNTTLNDTLPLDDTALVLFTGVDSLTLGTAAGSSAATTVDASLYFKGVAADTYNLVYSGVDAGGVVSIQKAGSVPEPTTGTLGLLALAGLMARRRRK